MYIDVDRERGRQEGSESEKERERERERNKSAHTHRHRDTETNGQRNRGGEKKQGTERIYKNTSSNQKVRPTHGCLDQILDVTVDVKGVSVHLTMNSFVTFSETV